jgi:hypothetical protein
MRIAFGLFLFAVAGVCRGTPYEETEALGNCVIAANAAANRYARQVAETDCRALLVAWRNACLRESPVHKGDQLARCDSYLKDVFGAIDERERYRELPAAERDLTAIAARFERGLPLPGLPNLNLPVYLKEGNIVCQSLGALRNPNTAILLTTGGCTFVKTGRIRILVHEPSNAREYVESYQFRGIRISSASAKMSSANVFHGWADLQSIEN